MGITDMSELTPEEAADREKTYNEIEILKRSIGETSKHLVRL